MKFQQISVALAVFAVAASVAGVASADKKTTKPTTPAAAAPQPTQPAPAVLTGPSIPGLCVLSQQGLIRDSLAGKYAINRLQQLQQQVQAELGGEQSAIQTDGKALEAQKASLPADQFQTRAQQINDRVANWQRKVQLRNAELQQTEKKSLGYIWGTAQPIVRQVVLQRSCSIVLDGNGVMAAGQGMDITPTVVQGLDAKLQSFPFEREHLDQNAAAPAAQ